MSSLKNGNLRATAICWGTLCAIWSMSGCVSTTADEPSTSLTTRTLEGLPVSVLKTVEIEDLLGSKADQIDQIPVPKPPFSKGVFPCSTCHSVLEDNFVKRRLTEDHTEIELNHGPREKWCFECHNQHNRDKLRLSNGGTISFMESYKLCGQCHGPKLRDWRAGVHGKRTGYWNGTKQYLLCAHCHNPHSPRFKSLEPMPAPNRPVSGY